MMAEIVIDDMIHARWLNTLSFLENAGARKISACEHRDSVGLLQLKHAAEEHRHAYYLKKQIRKLGVSNCETYQAHELLAPAATRHYLQKLDVFCSRYLKAHFRLDGLSLKYAAYLFVTYAIEVRADLLYPAYQAALDAVNAKVMVRSIIAEEEGHLEEMVAQLEVFSDQWQGHATAIKAFEQQLFEEWIHSVEKEVFAYAVH